MPSIGIEMIPRATIPMLDNMDTWGPVSLGAMFACLLQGAVFSMGINYFRQFSSKDHWTIRAVIIFILLITTAETGLVIEKDIQQTIIHALDVFYLLQLSSHPGEYILVLLTNITISTCQAFLCWRCLRFARAMQSAYGAWARRTIYVLAAVMGTLFLVGFVGSIMLPVRLSQATSLLEALYPDGGASKLTFWFYYVFSTFVALDVIIVVATTIQHRAARTGFGESTTILDVIVSLTLRNGAIILSCQIAQLLLYHFSASAWVLFPHSFLSRIYAITVLSTLTLPRTAQLNFRQKQWEEEAAVARESTGRKSANGTASGSGDGTGIGGGRGDGAVRYSSENPSQTSTRCVSCGSCAFAPTVYGSVGKKGTGNTPRMGYRNGGAGELGVSLGQSHLRQSPAIGSAGGGGGAGGEGPISFTAALFGLCEEEGSEGKTSPEIGVGGATPGIRQTPAAEVGLGIKDGGAMKHDDEKVDADGMVAALPIHENAVIIPVLVGDK